tara:strand:- start:580 stop:771 length:192 start_codon:yes stop_codon:yes gene_type:complete
METNYINKLLTSAVDAMQHTEWEWPPNWSVAKKKKFLEDCNVWLLEKELYERCKILKDVEEQL